MTEAATTTKNSIQNALEKPEAKAILRSALCITGIVLLLYGYQAWAAIPSMNLSSDDRAMYWGMTIATFGIGLTFAGLGITGYRMNVKKNLQKA